MNIYDEYKKSLDTAKNASRVAILEAARRTENTPFATVKQIERLAIIKVVETGVAPEDQKTVFLNSGYCTKELAARLQ